MSGVHSKARAKPSKPYPDFPLFPHATGRWAKKIRGNFVYFGPWDDPDAALEKYLAQKDALHAGRLSRADVDAATVKDAANAFLNHKQALLDNREISPHTWTNYRRATEELVKHVGKTRLVTDLDAQDFSGLRKKMAQKWGPHRLAVTIQHVRSVFKHAFEASLIATPLRFGPGFQRPTKKTFRLHRAAQGVKLFEPAELRRIIDAAGVPLKAMILLGINCGMGNSDCGNVPIAALDLEKGWLDYPRPKTGVARRCPLWPETVQAIRKALAGRPEPKDKDHAPLLFLTKYGQPWAKDTEDNPITKAMKKVLDSLGINGGRNFYTLRHTHRTIADETRDQPAADFIMGHAKDDMASTYRERIDDSRLLAVTEHVRKWLFQKPTKTPRRAS